MPPERPCPRSFPADVRARGWGAGEARRTVSAPEYGVSYPLRCEDAPRSPGGTPPRSAESSRFAGAPRVRLHRLGMVTARAEKTCATCGRTMQWRKRWANEWSSVRHCSEHCRRNRPGKVDREIEAVLLELAWARGASKTLCPSEAARKVRPEDWRRWMEATRSAARRLVAAGRLEMLQGGSIVDPSSARGPIRLRLRHTSEH